MQCSRMQELGMRVAPLVHAVDQTPWLIKEHEDSPENYKWHNVLTQLP